MSKGQGLGQYTQPLAYRKFAAPDEAQRGAIQSPIVGPDGGDKNYDGFIAAFLKAWRTQYLEPTRSAQNFISQVSASVAAAGESVTATFRVSEKHAGAILWIGVDPGASPGNITWFLRINGNNHPGFQNLIFNAANLSQPLWFQQELVQNALVELVAKNGGGVAATVIGQITGYQTLLAEGEDFGTSPANGIG